MPVVRIPPGQSAHAVPGVQAEDGSSQSPDVDGTAGDQRVTAVGAAPEAMDCKLDFANDAGRTEGRSRTDSQIRSLWGALAIGANQGLKWGWAIDYATVESSPLEGESPAGSSAVFVFATEG